MALNYVGYLFENDICIDQQERTCKMPPPNSRLSLESEERSEWQIYYSIISLALATNCSLHFPIGFLSLKLNLIRLCGRQCEFIQIFQDWQVHLDINILAAEEINVVVLWYHNIFVWLDADLISNLLN